MSSQVITTLPSGQGDPKSDMGEPEVEPGNPEVEPGNQKNFYRHVSGAGDGIQSETTAEFGPKANGHIIKPETENQDDPEPEIPQAVPETPKSPSTHIEPDWQKKIRSLQDQVNSSKM